MLKVNLFIGFKVTDDFAQKLSRIPAEKRDLYIQDNSSYLTETHYGNDRYLGRCCGELADIESLELSEKNIHSLLAKLVPDYPYDKNPLTVFTI